MPDSRSARNLGLPAVICAMALLTACGGGSSSGTPPGLNTPRTYQATASVGDFLTVTVDPGANTIAYSNHSNGQSGTLAYTVAADGAYTITAPDGGLLTAYEIPGFALVASANNTGTDHATTSLVTAILQAPITLGWLGQARQYNYMQWRTSLGGMDIGNVTFDGAGNVTHTGYWPFGAMQVKLGIGETPSAWDPATTFSSSQLTADPSGNFLTLPDGDGSDTIFATQGGFFVVDNPNGSIISVPQAGSSGFDPNTAGTYHALAFTKVATMGPGANTESGVGTVAGYTLTISNAGVVAVLDAGGNTVTSETLQPVADIPGLMATGTGQLPPCPGLFTYEIPHTTPGTKKQDVYLEFVDNAILFCSFAYDPTQVGESPTYSYFYGVALKQ